MGLIGKIKHVFSRGETKEEILRYWIEQGAIIGENFAFYDGYPIDGNWPWLVSIGNNVTLATNVKILAHDASTAKVDGVHTKVGIVSIGNNVFIGYNTVVLCNTRIGDNVIVGANSVVSKDLPSNGVYAGNPAKYICSFDEYSEKHQSNQKNHPVFREHRWYEWPNATIDEKNNMRERLKDTFGYM